MKPNFSNQDVGNELISIFSIYLPETLALFSQVERESDMRSLEEAHNRWEPGDLVGGG